MQFEPRTITLKDGRTAILRPPTADDAADMVAYLQETAGETHFLMNYPEERNIPIEKEEKFLTAAAEDPNRLFIVCEIDGRIAGNCELTFNTKIKVRHRADVGIALRKAYWNQGIGSRMFEMMIEAARAREGVEHMQLEFVEGNVRGRALYEKFGFQIVAVKPRALKLKDGTHLAEFIMHKYL